MNELFRAYINSDPVKAITIPGSIKPGRHGKDDKGMAASHNNLVLLIATVAPSKYRWKTI